MQGVAFLFGFLVCGKSFGQGRSRGGFFLLKGRQHRLEVLVKEGVGDWLPAEGASVGLFFGEPFAQRDEVRFEAGLHGVEQVVGFFVPFAGQLVGRFGFCGCLLQCGECLFLLFDLQAELFQSVRVASDGLQCLPELGQLGVHVVGRVKLPVNRDRVQLLPLPVQTVYGLLFFGHRLGRQHGFPCGFFRVVFQD